MSSRATPPDMLGYKPVYKGRRYWVAENNTAQPFDGWTAGYGLLIYDRRHDALAACGNREKDGTIRGEYLGGQGQAFHAQDIKDMIATINYFDKHYC